uniref:Uncharacterized protein n=1 Tax=Anguilla anguilla TaxID=7936 RepID=A0A0E9V5N8_ANGAN
MCKAPLKWFILIWADGHLNLNIQLQKGTAPMFT